MTAKVKAQNKVPVGERALVRRIKRELHEVNEKGEEFGKRLCKTREGRNRIGLGEYFIVDVGRRHVIETHVDIEALARKLGVLRGYEVLSEER